MENIKAIKECEFLNFYNSRTYSANCFNEDGSLNKNYNSFKSTGMIASIFEDHWENTYLENKSIIDKYRPNANNEIQKLLIVQIKNLVVLFTNVLLVTILSSLVILVNLVFAHLVVISTKTIELKISFKLLTIVNIGKLFLLFLNNLELVFSFPLKIELIFFLKLFVILFILF